MREVGRDMVIAGAAIAAPGIAALKMGIDFDTTMTRIVTLVGLAREEVDAMSESVLELAEETAQAPRALAEALFVITSAGARGAEAMEILEASAKATAVGLGQTEIIARAVVAAVTAFRKQNLTAAEATDILTATVREGNLEAGGLAGSLSRVLAPAAEVGVTFADVGAFIATFSRTGGDAAEATTALRSTFIALLKPTTDAEKALAEVGLSSEELRTQLRERGLVQTLITLKDAFDGNAVGLARVVPNVRALTGVLTTVGAQEEEFLRITESVTNSQGILAGAFEVTAETAGFKLRQALVAIQVELTQLGVDLIPMVTRAISVVNTLFTVFTSLPRPIKAAALAFGIVAGALLLLGGTISIVTGSLLALAPAAAGAAAAITALGAATGIALGPLGLAAIAVTVITAGTALFFLKQKLDEVTEATARQAAVQAIANEATIDQLRRRKEILAAQLANVQGLIDEITWQRAAGKATRDMEENEQRLVRTFRSLEEQLGLTSDALELLTDKERATERITQDIAIAMDVAAAAARGMADDLSGLSAQALATKFAVALLQNQVLDLGLDPVFTAQFDEFVARLRQAVEAEDEVRALADALLGLAGRRPAEAEAPSAALPGITKPTGLLTPEEAQRLLQDFRRRAIGEVDMLGGLIVTALRRQAQQQLDVRLAAIDADRKARAESVASQLDEIERVRDAEIDAINERRRALDEAHDRRVAQIERGRDAALAAIDVETQARVGALSAELGLLDAEVTEERRSLLLRELALAFDAKDRAAIEKQLRDLERDERRKAIRQEIRDVQDTGRKREDEVRSAAQEELGIAADQRDRQIEMLRDREEAARETFRSITEATREEAEAQRLIFDEREEAARRTFENITDAFVLEAKARQLLEQRNQEEIIALLESFAPEWRTAGLSLGEQLIEGIRESGIEEFIAALFALSATARATAPAPEVPTRASTVPTTPPEPRTPGPTDLARAAAINKWITEGIHAPFTEEDLEKWRKIVRALGGVPEFAHGLLAGPMPESGLAFLHRGEIVVNPAMGQSTGTVFERGAFEGMMSGASFAGSARENAKAIRIEFEELIDDQLGRGAFISGARA